MIIYSEVLDQKFSSPDECLKAEEEFYKKKEEEEALAAEKEKYKEQAYEKLLKAWDEYVEYSELEKDDLITFLLVAEVFGR